jgi:hypothetical protein
VGDGATPRTAALFAFLSKAGQCFAIDPLLEQGATSAANKSSSATATATATNAAEVQQQSEHTAQFFSKLSSGAGREKKESRSSPKQSAALVAHPWQTVRRISVKLFHEPTFSPPLCHITNLTKVS